MTRRDLDWLKRPIAHRGLHGGGRIENSASAIRAAIDGGLAIEVDLRCARDGIPIVFHDSTLNRLTNDRGEVAARDAADLCALPLRGTSDRILSLPDLLTLVGGKVPLVVEVKSNWGRDPRYERAIAAALGRYNGPVAVMSFDPNCVGAFRTLLPTLPRGLISEHFAAPYWSKLGAARRFAMRHLLTAAIARPDFIAYDVRALPALAPWIARNVVGLPLLTWTVRTDADRERAHRHADAMIFEGPIPGHGRR